MNTININTDPIWTELGPNDEAAMLHLIGLHQVGGFSQLLLHIDRTGERLGRSAALRARLSVMRGDALEALGDLTGALESYADARDFDPDYGRARECIRRILGAAYEELGRLRLRSRWEDAEALARALLRGDGPDDEITWMLGVTLDELGRADEAEDVLRGLVEATPLAVRHWHSLGVVQARRGELGDAIKTLEEGMKLLTAAGRETEMLEEALVWFEDEVEAAIPVDDDEGNAPRVLH